MKYLLNNTTKNAVIEHAKAFKNAAVGLISDDEVYIASQYLQVDMGTSVKWCSYYDIDDLFAWGETKTKSAFTEGNYKFYDADYMDEHDEYTKYNSADKLTQLETLDDAAAAIYGSGWRIPTLAEFRELASACTFTTKTEGSISYYTLTSKTTGNSITIHDGNGIEQYYWTSYKGSTSPDDVYEVAFDGESTTPKFEQNLEWPYEGRRILAVHD